MKNQLILDASQFDIREVTGLTPSICKTLASVALLDDIITLDEFVILANASKKIAQISGNPLLVNTLTLHWILNPVNLKVALKELSASAKDIDVEIKEAIFTVMNEVISLQGKEAEKIQSDVAHALGIDIKNISKQAKEILGGLSKSISSKLIFKQSRLERVKQFAQIYHHDELKVALKALSKDEQIDDKIEEMLKQSKSTVVSALSEFEASNQLHPDYEGAINQLNELCEAMIEQVRNRLAHIHHRISLEKQIFEEDFNSFLEDTALEYELVMKDRMFSSEYTRKDVWKEFTKTEASLIIQHRYERFRKKYQQLLDQWNNEVKSFAQELSIAQPALMRTFNRREFEEILPSTSSSFNALLEVDKVTGGVLDLAVLGALGTSLAISLGVIQGAAVVAALSNPVGMGIAGAVGLASLYKVIARPDIRINLEVGKMSKDLVLKLSEALDNPVEKHNQALAEIESKFLEIAETYYKPLVMNSKLATIYKDYNQKAMTKIINETVAYIEKL